MWLTESRRMYHMLFAIPFGFLFSLLFVAGLAIGMEIKDVDYNNGGGNNPLEWNWQAFDWLDICATLLGGVIGQILCILILILIF